MAMSGSTAKWLVVTHRELNPKMFNHSGSLPKIESTPEKLASFCYKTKKDKKGEVWPMDPMLNAGECLTFMSPRDRVFKRLSCPLV